MRIGWLPLPGLRTGRAVVAVGERETRFVLIGLQTSPAMIQLACRHALELLPLSRPEHVEAIDRAVYPFVQAIDLDPVWITYGPTRPRFRISA